MAATTRLRFARAVMAHLGIPDTPAHVGARRFLAGTWPHAETGEKPGLCNGVPGEGAAWNPFNTTERLPGSTDYNATAHVQNYRTEAEGAKAIALTLAGDARYAAFVHGLHRSFVTQQLCALLDATPWGTHQPLLEEARSAYMSDRARYNNYPIGA